MELCCTKTLLKQLGEEASEPVVGGKLQYWTCKGFVSRRKRFVIALNRETMLTVVVAGAPGKDLRERLARAVEDGLTGYGVSAKEASSEAEWMRSASFGKNRDRSLLGSLNDLEWLAMSYMKDLDDSEESLARLSRRLSETPHARRQPSFASESIDALFETIGS